jgi:hypothetical protein
MPWSRHPCSCRMAHPRPVGGVSHGETHFIYCITFLVWGGCVRVPAATRLPGDTPAWLPYLRELAGLHMRFLRRDIMDICDGLGGSYDVGRPDILPRRPPSPSAARRKRLGLPAAPLRKASVALPETEMAIVRGGEQVCKTFCRPVHSLLSRFCGYSLDARASIWSKVRWTPLN